MVVRTSLLLSLLIACGSSGEQRGPDGDLDGETLDASVDAAFDAQGRSFPHAGFGAIRGDCDVLDDELISVMPGLFYTTIDFASLYTDADLSMLTQGGQKLVTDDNAGGSSRLSEAFAYEVLERCEDAVLLKTETEIVYANESKKTDFLAELDGLKIGVSVTRAMSFPFDAPFPQRRAEELLTKKLGDILLSSESVSAEDKWTKQILAILAYGPDHSAAINAAYASLDAQLRADTLVLVIQSDGADEFIYCNGPCN